MPPPDPYGVPSRNRRTDPGVPHQATTPREVEQAIELAELRAALESQRGRAPKTVPPSLSLGSARWWVTLGTGLFGVGGISLATWNRVDPPAAKPDPAPIAVQATQARLCEERIASLERDLETLRLSHKASEDWLCGVLTELDLHVSRPTGARPCIRPVVTRPINRPIKLPVTVLTPMPTTP